MQRDDTRPVRTQGEVHDPRLEDASIHHAERPARRDGKQVSGIVGTSKRVEHSLRHHGACLHDGIVQIEQEKPDTTKVRGIQCKC